MVIIQNSLNSELHFYSILLCLYWTMDVGVVWNFVNTIMKKSTDFFHLQYINSENFHQNIKVTIFFEYNSSRIIKGRLQPCSYVAINTCSCFGLNKWFLSVWKMLLSRYIPYIYIIFVSYTDTELIIRVKVLNGWRQNMKRLPTVLFSDVEEKCRLDSVNGAWAG